eukprot:1575782-Rhodomonas_salina.2
MQIPQQQTSVSNAVISWLLAALAETHQEWLSESFFSDPSQPNLQPNLGEKGSLLDAVPGLVVQDMALLILKYHIFVLGCHSQYTNITCLRSEEPTSVQSWYRSKKKPAFPASWNNSGRKSF